MKKILRLPYQGEITMKDVVLEPQEILALYASPNQVEKGETVMLGDIKSQNQVTNSADIFNFKQI